MLERQKRAGRTSPAAEDLGLFAGEVCVVPVGLVPVFHSNKRGDVIITGVLEGERDIPILFAGRRVARVRPLVAALKALRSDRMRAAMGARLPPPDVMTLRLPCRIEGVWRAQFQSDPTGWDRRTFHLVAARWSYVDGSGRTVEGGIAPA